MYPEASIKLHFPPKTHIKAESKLLRRLTKNRQAFHAEYRSHEQRCAIRPLVHRLIQKTSNEKRDTLQNAKGLILKDLR
jgi:hypothetical protein